MDGLWIVQLKLSYPWAIRNKNDDYMTTTAPIASGTLGYDNMAVLSDALYEKEDHKADNIYEQIYQSIQSRRQRQRNPGL